MLSSGMAVGLPDTGLAPRPARLKVWRGEAAEAGVAEWADPPAERAYEWAMRETWRRYSSRHRAGDLVPFTLAWFDYLREKRYVRHAAWLPKQFELAKHKGERVLVHGSGLGTDAVRFAEHGANVISCTPHEDEKEAIRRNIELHGLKAAVHACPPTSLPAISETIDIVVLSFFDGLTHPLPAVLDEVFRVLRPGGKLIAVLPSRYGADYWRRNIFFWERWTRPRSAAAGQFTFTRTEIRRRLMDFDVRRITKRHLRRSDLPGYARWIYFPLLERVLGRCLLAKAVKPIRLPEILTQAA